MDYINCFLSKETTLLFIKHLNTIEFDGEDAKNYFERARTFDDVSLTVPLKLFFDISDKIRKGREGKITNDLLIKVAKELESESTEFFAYLDVLDKKTIQYVIQHDYLELRGVNGNLIAVLSEIHTLRTKGQII